MHSDYIENTASAKLNVYQNKNGIPEILPSQTIKVQPNGTKEIYAIQYGIPDISPSQVIKPRYHGGYEVYDTQNGLPSITPSKTIKENPYGGLDIYENINGISGIIRPSNPIPTEATMCTKTKMESLLSHRLL